MEQLRPWLLIPMPRAEQDVDAPLTATVTRGELTATLTSSGTLKPIQSITYRSPIPGRDIEIRELAPEGSKINEGVWCEHSGAECAELVETTHVEKV